MDSNYEALVDRAIELGATGAKLVPTDQVIFDPRSYLKCRFGCNRWGKYWTCPPNMDISPKDFQEAYDRYHSAIVIRTIRSQRRPGGDPGHRKRGYDDLGLHICICPGALRSM